VDWDDLKIWLLHRLQEKSTWGGIITVVVTLVGAQLAPAKSDAIETAGMTIASMIAIATKERKPVDEPVVQAPAK
jgi:hypothetical protein